MNARTLSCAAFLVLFAGCAKGAAEPTSIHVEELGGSDTTGAIHGIIIDEGLLPVAAANVTHVEASRTLRTDNAGIFAMPGVPIGTQTLLVSAPGYGSVSLKVEVLAEQTSHVDVTLKRIASGDAYYQTKQERGMFGCGATYRQSITTFNGAFYGLAVCGTGADTTGLDDFKVEMPLGDKLSLWRGAAFETTWTTNQVFGNGMVQDWAVIGCDNNRNATFTRDSGPSPLSSVLNAFQLQYRLDDMTANAKCGGDPAKEKCNEEDGCTIQNRMFSWPSTFGQDAQIDVGITLQQDFEAFFTEFFRLEPPRDFSALGDA